MKFTTEDVALHDAAVRAGVRTAAQSAGGAIAPLAVTAGVLTDGSLLAVAIAVGGAVVAAAVAGLAAYFGFIGRGLPDAYRALALDEATRPPSPV